jgi:hypothetical protein
MHAPSTPREFVFQGDIDGLHDATPFRAPHGILNAAACARKTPIFICLRICGNRASGEVDTSHSPTLGASHREQVEPSAALGNLEAGS